MSATSKPLERQLRENLIQPSKSQLVDIRADDLARRISSEVNDHCSTAWLKNTKHFVDGIEWLREILERGTANDEIKSIVFKGHCGRIATAKIDAHGFAGSVFPGDLDEGFADVEVSDFVLASLASSIER